MAALQIPEVEATLAPRTAVLSDLLLQYISKHKIFTTPYTD